MEIIRMKLFYRQHESNPLGIFLVKVSYTGFLKHLYKKEHGHIEVNEAGREIIPYLITLEIGKNVKAVTMC
ncbi:MAG: hypothetical protein ACLTUL_03095 [Blautia faecis]